MSFYFGQYYNRLILPSIKKHLSSIENLKSKDCFLSFQSNISNFSLPEKFTFPFYYEPHPLCVLAAQELQGYLKNQTDWVHDFGVLDGQGVRQGAIGKMFGVLVVQKKTGEIGYLAAFSGKLAGGNHHAHFVPPVFDMLRKDGFFRQEETVLNALNRQIEQLEMAPAYLECISAHQAEEAYVQEALAKEKEKVKSGKRARKQIRQEAKSNLSEPAFAALQEKLKQQSLKENYYYKDALRYWRERLDKSQAKLAVFTDEIAALKSERKQRSAALQKKLFDQYQFLNQAGVHRSLCAIFEPTIQKTPPAGAGECAAPKLLQYAFQKDWKPIAMAEFWWGQPPKSAVRKHGQFYPACRGKCEPILAHMLAGIPMDENPMLQNPAANKTLEIVYEDDSLLVIHKPTEFLSVPGKNIQDSVAARMKKRFPQATGPMVVHRLDMSTSGLMLIAKTEAAYKFLQYQFIKRTIKKRYVALLEGVVEGDEGTIDLPLRVDLDNRPQQLVCYEHGKSARTKWQVVERSDNRTKIHFFPVTGRTHQLRVHAAHPLGLNAPIVGDDLYGTRANRLHLHAEWIAFRHPDTEMMMEIEIPTKDF